jgi:RNA polymerase primary sigma factor
MTAEQEAQWCRKLREELSELEKLESDILRWEGEELSQLVMTARSAKYAKMVAARNTLALKDTNYAKVWKRICTLRNEAVSRNTRLVLKLVRKLMRNGLPVADLMQAGILGMMRGAATFDPNRGIRFTTYAMWWARHGIMRFIQDKGRLVRIPCWLQRSKEAVEKLTSLKSEVHELEYDGKETLQVTHARSMGGHDEGEQRILLQLDASRMKQELVNLSPREKDILVLRFGLSGVEKTLDEIGQEYGITRERVRQIEANAIRKLKARILPA